MSFIELLILAIGLAMDAFAISICKGLSFGKLKLKHYLIVGAYFGGFQFGMTVAGYYIGINFSSFIEAFDHWVVFGLLMLIGLNMIRESLDKNDDEINDKLDVKTMVLLAIASSIDALAVGVSFCIYTCGNLLYCSCYRNCSICAFRFRCKDRKYFRC